MDIVEAAAARWRELHPDLNVEPLLVVGRVQRLWALWDARLRGRFAEAGLHPGDFDVLAALRRTHGATTPGDLARSMLVTAGATTKRVDRLEAAGLVERITTSGDGRQRPVRLTPAATVLTDRLMAAHLDGEKELLAALTPAEEDQLRALLARLLEAAEG